MKLYDQYMLADTARTYTGPMNWVEVQLVAISTDASRGDFGGAHAREIELYHQILHWIRDATLNPEQHKEIAALALTSMDIEFARYSA